MSAVRSTKLWVRTGDAREIGVECKWVMSEKFTDEAGGITPVQTIDVAFLARDDIPRPFGAHISKPCVYIIQTEQGGTQQLTAEVLGRESAFKFLNECLQPVVGTSHPGTAVARFVVPLQSGTIIRSDIVPFRLGDTFWVDKAESFASPLQVYPGSPLSLETISLTDIFRASAGAALLNAAALHSYLKPGTGPSIQIPSEIEVDFKNKLSMLWISVEPIPRKRLILVGSSNQDPEGGGWTQFARRAAVALGIDLVFIDRADGWLARGNYTSWYEALLPAPASWWAAPSADVLVRIVEDYKAQNEDAKIDGIATSVEALQLPVSIAASRLGLPHEKPSAFERATNKYKLGLFQNRPAFLVSSAEDVLALVRCPQNQLAFPLIVKPSFGLNSEGVTRVDNTSELEEAIEVARATGRSKDDVGDRVLVERYCEGPEVDVNMVLVDSEVIFSEICDDFPKGADLDDDEGNTTIGRATSPVRRRNFQETNMVFPSALPNDELAALRNAVKDTIQGLGFRNGVMHVEARIAHSKCSYQSAGGIVDLRPRKRNGLAIREIVEVEQDVDVPTPWIIEINPRPPGLFASQTPGSVYGIDYWGVTLLLGTGDKARASVLSRPFATGAQNHTVLVMIRAEFDSAREGIFDSDDVCVDFLKRHPELRQHIGRNGCLLKRGQRIPHPSGGRNTFVAYMNVFSRKSRQEALEIAKMVRDGIRYEIR
ncbi:hypothetical protein F5B22DRAFT_643507 [Xylaria bambusicola]|uniref:uncharacterized protein n=1 Tax=Xylaria bambusicola TaxID=326684 RepID=UPI0020088BFE|nr:uncharacterized protein F5B22DRAFT_643507 [Xylaria bambusicola]KAI0521926.1 hypothetical protein F5B22DRAFT_643507 [Xylaria bambusicola]